MSNVEVSNRDGINKALMKGRKFIGDDGVDVNVGISDGFKNFVTG